MWIIVMFKYLRIVYFVREIKVVLEFFKFVVVYYSGVYGLLSLRNGYGYLGIECNRFLLRMNVVL